MALSDEVILKQYRQGDIRAFRTLVDRHSAAIYNLAFRMLRDTMEAENVTQETFLRVITSLDRLRLDQPFKPYLFQIAVNLCHDILRKKRPMLFSDITDNVINEEISALHAGAGAVEEVSNLWDKLEEEELVSQLNSAIHVLPAIYQTVIALRYGEEFSYDDIALTLNMPLNTIRTHLHRAKQQLRMLIEQGSYPI